MNTSWTGPAPALAAALRRTLPVAILVGTATVAVPAQGILDRLDGETLYDGGFLLTAGFDLVRDDVLRRGGARVTDPSASHETELRTTLALQYGLRNNVQIGIAVPYVAHEAAGIGLQNTAEGLGDVSVLGKWRFYRWDAPGKALNVSLLAELSLPTGEDDARSDGVRLEPELQPGAGGLDPALGFGLTHEPERWRFNAACLYRLRTDTDDDGWRLGDEFVSELAIGNRFWLQPYPGPFMRADLAVRYYWQDESRASGPVLDSGGERAAFALTWAFRPRPSLDFQASIEIPFWRDVNGTQLDTDWEAHVTFGYRF